MLNHIVLMGRLTRDPELRQTQSGVSVASFTIAVDRDFQSRDGGEKQTFIYRFLMPYIAFRMERERRYELSIKQLQRIIK